jgi:hypothetical protein
MASVASPSAPPLDLPLAAFELLTIAELGGKSCDVGIATKLVEPGRFHSKRIVDAPELS